MSIRMGVLVSDWSHERTLVMAYADPPYYHATWRQGIYVVAHAWEAWRAQGMMLV